MSVALLNLDQARTKRASEARDNFNFGCSVEGYDDWFTLVDGRLACWMTLDNGQWGREVILFLVGFNEGTDQITHCDIDSADNFFGDY